MFDLFARLDPTAGEVPARAVSMANEKHARRMIDDDGLDAESHQIGARKVGRTNSLQQSRNPFQVRRDDASCEITRLDRFAGNNA